MADDEPGPAEKAVTAARGVYMRAPIVNLLLVHLTLAVMIPLLWSRGELSADNERLSYTGTRASLYRDVYLDVWAEGPTAPKRAAELAIAGAFEGNDEPLPPGEQPRELSEVDAGEQAGRILTAEQNQTDAPTAAPTEQNLTDAPTAAPRAPIGKYVHFSLHVLYQLKDGNMLDEKPLWTVRQFEERLRSLPGWQSLCRKGGPGDGLGAESLSASCDPGESLVSYAWPTRGYQNVSADCVGLSCSSEKLTFDGRGGQWLPLEVGLSSAFGSRDDAVDRLLRFLPPNSRPKRAGEGMSSDLVQSHFLFSLPHTVPLIQTEAYTTEDDAREAFASFINEELFPKFQEDFQPFEDLGIRPYLQGAESNRYELFRQLWSDSCWSIAVAVLSLLMVALMTRHVTLTLGYLLVACESLLLSYLMVKHISGDPDVSLVNVAVIFLMNSHALDSLTACVSGWRVSGSGPHLHKSCARQEAMCIQKCAECARIFMPRWWLNSDAPVALAGTACVIVGFMCSLLGRSLLAREAGLFVGLALLAQLLLGALTYPPLVALSEQIQQRRRRGEAETAVSLIEGAGDSDGLRSASDQMLGLPVMDKAASFLAARFPRVVKHTRALGVILTFAVFGIIGLVCNLSAAEINASVPRMFPTGSHQDMGRRLLGMFDPGAAVDTASSAALHDAWIYDVVEPRVADESGAGLCRDQHVSCGGWAATGACEWNSEVAAACQRSCGKCSFPVARSCLLEEELLPEQRDAECSCHDPSGVSSSSSWPSSVHGWDVVALRIKVMISGLPAGAWPEVEANFTALFESFAPSVGSTTVQRRGYHLSGDLSDRNYTRDVIFEEERLLNESSSSAWAQVPLVQVHWRSGAFAVRDLFEAPTYSIISYPRSQVFLVEPRTEELRLYCYCGGVPACASARAAEPEHSWNVSFAEPLEATTPDGVDANPEHPLFAQRTTVQTPSPAHVSVVWGITVNKPSEALSAFVQGQGPWQDWTFDLMFEAGDPWTQRTLMSFVSNMPSDLRAEPEDMLGPWPKVFEQWLVKNGKTFPARNFHTEIQRFIVEYPDFHENFIFQDGKVKALRLGFLLTVPNDIGSSGSAEEAEQLKESWESYVEERSREGGLHGGGAWCTSPLWLRSEAFYGLQSCVAHGCLAVIAAGMTAVALLTWSPGVCVFVFASVANSTMLLSAIIFTWFGWPLGFVESIALVAATGQAFMPCLYVSHAYVRAPADATLDPEEETQLRTQYALESALPRVLASLVLSFWVSVFLLCCRLEFFVTFGAFGAIGSLLSALHALLLLPALLCEVGPTAQTKPATATAERCKECCCHCFVLLDRLQTQSENVWDGFTARFAKAPKKPDASSSPGKQDQALSLQPVLPAPAEPAPAAASQQRSPSPAISSSSAPQKPSEQLQPTFGRTQVIQSGGSTFLNSGRRKAASKDTASDNGSGAGSRRPSVSSSQLVGDPLLLTGPTSFTNPPSRESSPDRRADPPSREPSPDRRAKDLAVTPATEAPQASPSWSPGATAQFSEAALELERAPQQVPPLESPTGFDWPTSSEPLETSPAAPASAAAPPSQARAAPAEPQAAPAASQGQTGEQSNQLDDVDALLAELG